MEDAEFTLPGTQEEYYALQAEELANAVPNELIILLAHVYPRINREDFPKLFPKEYQHALEELDESELHLFQYYLSGRIEAARFEHAGFRRGNAVTITVKSEGTPDIVWTFGPTTEEA